MEGCSGQVALLLGHKGPTRFLIGRLMSSLASSLQACPVRVCSRDQASSCFEQDTGSIQRYKGWAWV